jgi:hypothetical protein
VVRIRDSSFHPDLVVEPLTIRFIRNVTRWLSSRTPAWTKRTGNA